MSLRRRILRPRTNRPAKADTVSRDAPLRAQTKNEPCGSMETSIFYYSFLHGIIAIKRRLPERRRHIMRAKTAISEIDAQIEKLREKRRGIVAKANER